MEEGLGVEEYDRKLLGMFEEHFEDTYFYAKISPKLEVPCYVTTSIPSLTSTLLSPLLRQHQFQFFHEIPGTLLCCCGCLLGCLLGNLCQ